ncbi:hypothetical protein KO527_24625 [Pseudoalteromonas sp. C2R02]|uniref:hypothetical protein n=1 Tax=Pseudoalteromonas sp. C2R02 TaxID=2841565 RepID=UPI001C0A38F9|nr:hypothetical protein [Pseudoalteromonas sp. C2R02]MBU2972524.1 hypothetical protein [Pseudoalteromonas sp. C2R02]
MYKYIVVLASIIISGCSNLNNSNFDEFSVRRDESKYVCNKISRPKHVINRCKIKNK